jgi:hypothetical protein
VGVLGGAPCQVRAVVDPCSHLQAKDQIMHKAFYMLSKKILIWENLKNNFIFLGRYEHAHRFNGIFLKASLTSYSNVLLLRITQAAHYSSQ